MCAQPRKADTEMTFAAFSSIGTLQGHRHGHSRITAAKEKQKQLCLRTCVLLFEVRVSSRSADKDE